MADLAQNTVQKISQILNRLPKLPAEMTPRNILIFCVVSLLCLGSVMVASASMPYAEYIHENPFYFLIRHGISIVVAAVVAFLTYRVSLNLWFKNAFPLWLITIILLLAVLVVGSEVNGAHRWIKVGGFTIQPTEIAKIVMAIFTADYVVRRAKEVRTHWKGLLRLSGVMALTVGFIVAEPDLGATAVIVLMMVGVFFLAGAPATQFLIMLGAILAGMVARFRPAVMRWIAVLLAIGQYAVGIAALNMMPGHVVEWGFLTIFALMWITAAWCFHRAAMKQKSQVETCPK